MILKKIQTQFGLLLVQNGVIDFDSTKGKFVQIYKLLVPA